MKVAITSQGKDVSSSVDLRFGRAKWILLIDTDTDDVQVYDNTVNLNSASGAGIQTGARIAEIGAKTVITGNVGPNAFKTLQAAEVDVFLCKAQSVEDALGLFKADKLQSVDQANVEGHWT